MKKKNILLLVVCLLLTEALGVLGGLFNVNTLNTWYVELVKSPLNPPSWVFGPAWTILFALMGIALYLVIRHGHARFFGPHKAFTPAIAAFIVQFVLNGLWSYFFFYLQSPVLGFIEILLLIISIVVTMYYFYKIKPAAAYILIPYLAWVCFATYLNFSIWQLN